jgi:hypothetical protein
MTGKLMNLPEMQGRKARLFTKPFLIIGTERFRLPVYPLLSQ